MFDPCFISGSKILHAQRQSLAHHDRAGRREEHSNCLESVRGLFDEIVVVDTGSKDRTREIAREFGARVFDFVWVDDFAAARNAALARATGDYAFWLDADDVVDPPEREKLQALLDSLQVAEPAARMVCTADPTGEPMCCGARAIRGRMGMAGRRWSTISGSFRSARTCAGRIAVHEQILPALRRANVPVRWTDITVRHTGYTDRALRERKLQRDRKILEAELAERPDDPFVLFNLGLIAVERKDWPRALDSLRTSLAGSAPTDSIVRKLFALIARCHQMLGDLPAAHEACSEGLRIDPDDAELLFRNAVVHRHSGEPALAEACWRRLLTLQRPNEFSSVDQGIYGHLTLRNLAALAEERGDRDEERRLWTEILTECPGDAEALARLERGADASRT